MERQLCNAPQAIITLKIAKKYRKNGGGKRTRTDDPLLAKQMLYQLSYAPNFYI